MSSTMAVIWRTATDQGFELALDDQGVVLAVQLEPFLRTSFLGNFTLHAPIGAGVAFVTKVAASLGVSGGSPNPNPEPPGVVRGRIHVFDYKPGSALKSKLAIESPREEESAERAEVSFNVGPRKGAAFSTEDADQNPLVVDFLARGLRDGAAWDAGIRAAAAPRLPSDSFDQFFPALEGSDAAGFEQLRTEPERFVAFIEPLVRELDAVRKTRRSLRRRVLLDVGRRALEELAPTAACAEFALQLDDADEEVRHGAVSTINLNVAVLKKPRPFFSRSGVAPALASALDTFVTKFVDRASKQTLELAIEARRRLAPR